ncbi:hypothetical protein OICFNHDK_2087 [Methylobacterium bullatum]|jgi:hypothetical protein|uniref:Uncharacterized protein n=2 Tax=Methylobacteriaceae TaxID=119045 RepID=A0AAV4Z7U4_9HYPH|nr:hypothetical protein OICFNHDK_2087 [Methylobacterium bullatum]
MSQQHAGWVERWRAMFDIIGKHRMTKALRETRTSSDKAHSPTTASPLIRVLVPALVFTAIAGPAFASACSDQIATIERRLNSSGAVSVTGTASADGKVASNPSMGLDAPPGGKPTDPSTTPNAKSVDHARHLIEQARKQEAAGDAKGCENTMTEAKKAAGSLP